MAKGDLRGKAAGLVKPSRNIIIAVIAFVAMVCLSFWFLMSSVNASILKANIDTMEELTLHDERCVENSINLRFECMESASKKLGERSFSSLDAMLAELPDIATSIPSATRVSLLDAEGTQYVSTGLVTKNSYLADICKGRDGRFIARENTKSFFTESQREVLFEGVPVNATVEGRKMEWLVAQFPISTLEDELKISSYGGKGFSSVIDKDGNYVINMSRTHDFLSRDNFFEDLSGAKFQGSSGIDEVLATASATGSASATYELDGQKYIMVISNMGVGDWYFITTVPTSVFDAQTRAISGSFLLLLMIVAIVLVVIFVLILRHRKQSADLRISEAASNAKTEFLFSMSHDIRTPMNAILGYADIGLRHIGNAETSEDSFKKIKSAGDHLLSLINDILEMSRIESGKIELLEEPMDIREVVDGVAEMGRALAMGKDIELTVDMVGIDDPYVLADELHANEVLINLISNAVKYTPAGGRITYRAEQVGAPVEGIARFRFIISDTGIGMSEEFQKRIFESFSREETATVSQIEGAGLGLSIVKRIVDLAGGTIEAKSKIGEGSTFIVEIPMRVMDEAAIGEYRASQERAAGYELSGDLAGKHVLLVEDNEMNREIATEILGDEGIVVTCAEDGDIAVRRVSEAGAGSFDFILMDIQMPVMDGYAATKAIRGLPGGREVPIIAVSANAFEEDRRKSLEAGMDAHVAKPINISELLDTLATLSNEQ